MAGAAWRNVFARRGIAQRLAYRQWKGGYTQHSEQAVSMPSTGDSGLSPASVTPQMSAGLESTISLYDEAAIRSASMHTIAAHYSRTLHATRYNAINMRRSVQAYRPRSEKLLPAIRVDCAADRIHSCRPRLYI